MVGGGSEKISYYFIVGSDQFNPNIYSLFDEGREKVWKDYSISQQLALHNVYAVERDYLEFFTPPKWFKNQIYFSLKLQYNKISATSIRFNQDKKYLQQVCYHLVAQEIINKNLWGY